MSNPEVIYENGPGDYFMIAYHCERCRKAVVIENDREAAKALYDWVVTRDGRGFCKDRQAERDKIFVRL